MKLIKVLSITALAIFMSSCCGCRKPSSYYTQFDKLLGSEWKLVQKDDQTFASGGQNYTITFPQERTVAGVGDCNRFSGLLSNSVTKTNQKFSISQISATSITCVDSATEKEYFEFLKNAHNIELDGELMMMQSTDSSGKTHRWVFEKTSKK